MKLTELQIGDCVCINGLNEQVFEIAYHQIKKEMTIGILDPQGEVYYCYEGYDHIEPIPLTAEILKEIGFEPRDEHFILSDGYYDIDIWEYSDGIWIARFDCCEMNMPSEQLTISYLHELQQFLRHCQTQINIEL